jgi:glycosyltransferase involved in cell wall biosynthesis
MPTISVIIPTYNRAGMLKEALESALAQNRLPDEIVVVDDGSTDNTAQVVAGFGAKIRYIQQKNAGPSAARNHGIAIATGEFVAFLDSDDLWPKDRLQRQLAALEKHPDLDFIFGLEEKFDNAKHFERYAIRDREVLQALSAADCIVSDPLALLLRENFIPTSSVLFRRHCLDRVGMIDESLHQAEDYDFWFRFALQGCVFGFCNAALCYRRQHDGNLVNQFVNRTVSTLEVLKRYQNHSASHKDQLTQRLSALHYDLGSHLFYIRDFQRARQFLSLAQPTGPRRMVRSTKIALARLFS